MCIRDSFTSSHAEGENIVHVTKFSGAEKYIDSKNLKSVEIINKFGGCEIYMDKAVPSGNEVYVRVECMCGGVEILSLIHIFVSVDSKRSAVE